MSMLLVQKLCLVPKEKNIIKINVTPDAKAVVEQLAERYGMKEYAVASSIYQWFGAQDDIYQRAVLGMLDGLEVDAARAFMERWAKGKAARPTGDEPRGPDRVGFDDEPPDGKPPPRHPRRR